MLTAANRRKFRRNRVHIKPDLTYDTEDESDDDVEPEDAPAHVPDVTRGRQGYGFVPPYKTRSGRTNEDRPSNLTVTVDCCIE